jgi:DNA-binding XRE family transcriptional regulator
MRPPAEGGDTRGRCESANPADFGCQDTGLGVRKPPANSRLASVSVYAYTLTVELRLRSWRERRGYSLRQLGERAGASFVTLYRIEAGRMSPTVAMLEKLAKALGIHIADLFPPKPRSKRRGTR